MNTRSNGIGARRGRWLACAAAGALGIAALAAAAPAAAQESSLAFRIEEQPLADALLKVSRQGGVDIMAPEAVTRGRTAPAVSGRMTVPQALTRLLAGTGLRFRRSGENSYLIESARGEDQAGSAAAEIGSAGASSKGIAEILVRGSRSQNVDIRRTEDDAQPYVVFDSEEVEKSGANNLEEFLNTRLSMNATRGSAAQTDQTTLAGSIADGLSNNSSAINLRGLGVQQTLILVDGRRVARTTNRTGDFLQSDINGIPLGAIERIEILPSSAGGIHGGNAVGGVINIIRKRDYKGLDLRLSYDAPVRGGGETYEISLAGGFSLEQGRTQVSFSASQSGANKLLVGDNGLWREGRRLYFENSTSELTSPVLGATPNICAATFFAGFCDSFIAPLLGLPDVPLVLDPAYGGASLGSGMTFVPAGYAGAASDGVAALVENAGRQNLDLSNDSRGLRSAMRGNPRVRSANINVRRSVSSATDAFVDLTWSENLGRALYSLAPTDFSIAADAPNNPFQQQILVTIPVVGLDEAATSRGRTTGAVGGLIARLGHGWNASAEAAWSRSRVGSQATHGSLDRALFNAAVLDGTVDILRDLEEHKIDYTSYRSASSTEFSPIESEQWLLSARASGPLFDIWGGPVVLTALAERRMDEVGTITLISRNAPFLPPYSAAVHPSRSQGVNSAYAELRVPVLSEMNAIPFARELEASFALRHDRYRTTIAVPDIFFLNSEDQVPPVVDHSSSRFQSTDYTVTLGWTPVRGIKLRGSYATGFLPPALSQSVPGIYNPHFPFLHDPRRGNTLVAVPIELNSRGDAGSLDPERSKSLSLGLVLTPSVLPKFRISADYSRISKRDEITQLFHEQVLANEDSLPGWVERDAPSPADEQLGWAGPVRRLKGGWINLAESKVEALDFQLDYSLDVAALGEFHFYAVATHALGFERQLTPTTPHYDAVGKSDGPLKWRGNIGLDWTKHGWGAGWNMQYYHRYSLRYGDPTQDALFGAFAEQLQGTARIPGQSYHDLYARYRFGSDGSGILNGLELGLGIRNVFDTKPPVVAAAINGYSAYGDPRLRRITLSVKKHF